MRGNGKDFVKILRGDPCSSELQISQYFSGFGSREICDQTKSGDGWRVLEGKRSNGWKMGEGGTRNQNGVVHRSNISQFDLAKGRERCKCVEESIWLDLEAGDFENFEVRPLSRVG
jgi:hypothetical protein